MQLEKERKTAAKRGFGPKVAKVKEDIENYTEAIDKYREKCDEAKVHLVEIRQQLSTTDARLNELQPRLKLDGLEDRCELT